MKVKVIAAILSVVLVAGAGTAVYFYLNQKKPDKPTEAVEWVESLSEAIL